MPRTQFVESAAGAIAEVGDGDHGVFLIEPEGVVVRDRFGISFAELQALVDVPVIEAS